MRHLSTDVVASMVVERLSLLWSRRKTGVMVEEEEKVSCEKGQVLVLVLM